MPETELTTGRFDVKSPDTEALRESLESRTSLADKVRPADSGDEAFDTAFNAGRNAVLHAAQTSRNPLAGILSASERQTLIAAVNAQYEAVARAMRNAPNEAQKNAQKGQLANVLGIAHKLGLHLDG